ncbi:MAG: DUF6438 domain-containing protein [Chloroflexota bacterium]|nr:DUF6438 domain-containing protein [Chloroflexota bacterium]
MTRPFAYLSCLSLGLLCLACAGSDVPATPTLVALSATPVATAPVAATATDVVQATPSATAIALTPTVGGQAPLTFAAIQAAIQRIQTDNLNKTYDEQQAALSSYTASLIGKPVQAWDGWVSLVYKDNSAYQVQLYAEDPYHATPVPTQIKGTPAAEPLLLNLSQVDAAQAQTLRPGQHLHVDGTVAGIEASFSPAIQITTTHLTLAEPVGSNPGPAATPVALATPLVVPTAAPVAAGQDTAPTLAEIQAHLQTLQTPEALAPYLAGLTGKTVTAWDGWVINTAGPQDGSDQPANRVLISLNDPYASAASVAPTTAAQKRPGLDSPAAAQVTLQFATAEAVQKLRPGQRIRFNGTLGQVSGDYRRITLPIVATSSQVIEDRVASVIAPADLAGIVLALNRTPCFGACPSYRVTVYGNGVVVWEGDQYVALPGAHISVISLDQVRELVAAFTKADYFALDNSYTDYRVTDMAYINTLFSRGGKTKTVQHYLGDRTAPSKLAILEAQIDGIIGTAPWSGQDR